MMDQQNQSADSFDATLIGHSRRIPVVLPQFQGDADLNEVEIEVPKDEMLSSDRVPVKKERQVSIVGTKTHMKVFLFLYFTCCSCICRRSRSTVVVPTVAHKYMVAEDPDKPVLV